MEGLAPLLDTDPERLLEMYKVNIVGPLMLTQALASALVHCGGSLVNIGSVGVYGLPFHGGYASSKVGHAALTFSAHISLDRSDTDDDVIRRPSKL